MSTEIRITKDRAAWRQHGWTAIPNALVLDSTLGWEEKGAFAWLSLAADDPEFDVTAESLAAAGPKAKGHAQRMIRELEKHGWLTRVRRADPGGAPVMLYELQPLPVPGDQRTWRPSTAKPRPSAFAKVKPQNLHVRSSGADPQNLHVQVLGADQAKHVSAGQAPKPARVSPARAGRHTSLPKELHACMHDDLWEVITTATGIGVESPGRRSVAGAITEALDGGWDVERLSAWVAAKVTAAHGRMANPAGFVVGLLREIPSVEVATARREMPTAPVRELPPVCGQCEARPGEGPAERTVTNDKGRPVRCPRCHPAAIRDVAESAPDVAV